MDDDSIGLIIEIFNLKDENKKLDCAVQESLFK